MPTAIVDEKTKKLSLLYGVFKKAIVFYKMTPSGKRD
jgi:hypothetical protein